MVRSEISKLVGPNVCIYMYFCGAGKSKVANTISMYDIDELVLDGELRID